MSHSSSRSCELSRRGRRYDVPPISPPRHTGSSVRSTAERCCDAPSANARFLLRYVLPGSAEYLECGATTRGSLSFWAWRRSPSSLEMAVLLPRANVGCIPPIIAQFIGNVELFMRDYIASRDATSTPRNRETRGFFSRTPSTTMFPPLLMTSTSLLRSGILLSASFSSCSGFRRVNRGLTACCECPHQ